MLEGWNKRYKQSPFGVTYMPSSCHPCQPCQGCVLKTWGKLGPPKRLQADENHPVALGLSTLPENSKKPTKINGSWWIAVIFCLFSGTKTRNLWKGVVAFPFPSDRTHEVKLLGNQVKVPCTQNFSHFFRWNLEGEIFKKKHRMEHQWMKLVKVWVVCWTFPKL